MSEPKPRTGLYRVWWLTGGCSHASIGMKSDGTRWIAPSNWIAPGDYDPSKILRLEPVVMPIAGVVPGPWLDHIQIARDLLDTILTGDDHE